jgi:hypothetical protein
VRALGFLAALPLLAGLVGCSSINTAIPTTTPVLLGPLDRIGGRPLPEPEDGKEFEGEEESALMICMASGIPTVSATHPLKGTGVVDSLGGGLAAHAGEHRLRDLTPRLTRLGTGAWVMFFAGCYGQAWWTSTRGTSEVAR